MIITVRIGLVGRGMGWAQSLEEETHWGAGEIKTIQVFSSGVQPFPTDLSTAVEYLSSDSRYIYI